jgi:hypothetical protein
MGDGTRVYLGGEAACRGGEGEGICPRLKGGWMSDGARGCQGGEAAQRGGGGSVMQRVLGLEISTGKPVSTSSPTHTRTHNPQVPYLMGTTHG